MRTQLIMTANRSSRTSSSALHRTVPMRTPVALLRETYSICTHQRHHDSCCPRLLPHHRVIALEFAAWIVVLGAKANAQIAIAHRRL
jgi:hypothetical protein